MLALQDCLQIKWQNLFKSFWSTCLDFFPTYLVDSGYEPRLLNEGIYLNGGFTSCCVIWG